MNKMQPIVIFLLISLNLIILYKYIDLINNIEELSLNEQVGIDQTVSEFYYHRPVEDLMMNFNENDMKNLGFKFIAIIPENSCGLCLKYDTPLINEFYIKHKEQISVYYLGQSNYDYFRGYDRLFDYEFVQNPDEIFPNYKKSELHLEKPTYLIVDSNSRVQSVYVTNLKKLHLSDVYFKNLNSFFDSI
jgi:hypothetical protein